MSKLLRLAAVAAAALAAGLRSTAAWSRAASRLTWASGGVPGLGPMSVDIAASPETVFAAAAAPYAERRPRALMEKVHIWSEPDRGSSSLVVLRY